jgi:ABC-type sugar transport system substrate-binding protein
LHSKEVKGEGIKQMETTLTIRHNLLKEKNVNTKHMRWFFMVVVMITAIIFIGGCTPTATVEPEKVVVTVEVTKIIEKEPQTVVVTATPSAEEVITEAPEEEGPQLYRPVLRPATKKWKIGYTDGGSQFDVSVIRWKGIQEAAAEAGVELIYCDNAYPDTQKHIQCAEDMVLQKPDLVISSSWIADLNTQIMDIYNEANIPVIAWDGWHPNPRSFYGRDVWTMGTIAGQWAGVWAMDHCNYDQTIVLMDNPEVGEFARQILWGFEAGVKAWFPGIDPSDVYTIGGGSTTDLAQAELSAWLTAHPDEHCVLVTMINNYSAAGAAAAFDIAGRSQDGCIVASGADAPMFAEFKIPEEESAYKASVTDSPWLDGYNLIAMAVDILEGVDVPPISLKPVDLGDVITRDNVDELVPEEYQQ